MKVTGKQKNNTSIYLRYNLVWDSLQYRGELLLVGFIDSDWVNDPDDRKSTTGCVFSLGYGSVTCAFKKKHTLGLSLAKEKY